MNIRLIAASLSLVTLAACASAPPIRYYTLLRPLDAGALPQQASMVDVDPVKVPAAADYPQLVVRQGAERVALVEGQQWIAPLPDEIRNGLTARLAGIAAPDGVRLSVAITRFESVLGGYALVEAQWQLRGATRDATLQCAFRRLEPVADGFDALVAGHQRALDALADAVARAVPTVAPGAAPACPPAV